MNSHFYRIAHYNPTSSFYMLIICSLVFSQSLLSLDLIEEFLAMCCNLGPNDKEAFTTKHKPGTGQWFRNIDYFRMDGSIDGHRRQMWINDFNNPDEQRFDFVLISLIKSKLDLSHHFFCIELDCS